MRKHASIGKKQAHLEKIYSKITSCMLQTHQPHYKNIVRTDM